MEYMNFVMFGTPNMTTTFLRPSSITITELLLRTFTQTDYDKIQFIVNNVFILLSQKLSPRSWKSYTTFQLKKKKESFNTLLFFIYITLTIECWRKKFYNLFLVLKTYCQVMNFLQSNWSKNNLKLTMAIKVSYHSGCHDSFISLKHSLLLLQH